jgi:uncharacterized protein (DUF1330 family)
VALVFIILAALAAVVAALWLVGANEKAYAISEGEPQWFIAVRGEPGAFAHGVTQRWSSRTDFAFIGADDAYWHRFIVASGGDAATLPIALDRAEDAFVARVRLRRPPRLLLGVLKLLIGMGVLSRPQGPVVADAQQLTFRTDIMPGAQAISRLLAQPLSYGPAMVNFLGFYDHAKYSDGRNDPGSGHSAYMRYGIVALRTVYRTGGRLIFAGRILSVLREAKAGPTMGRWDDVAAMQYPTPQAILSMEHAPDYHAALDDRDAGLERTVVIATTPT